MELRFFGGVCFKDLTVFVVGMRAGFDCARLIQWLVNLNAYETLCGSKLDVNISYRWETPMVLVNFWGTLIRQLQLEADQNWGLDCTADPSGIHGLCRIARVLTGDSLSKKWPFVFTRHNVFPSRKKANCVFRTARIICLQARGLLPIPHMPGESWSVKKDVNKETYTAAMSTASSYHTYTGNVWECHGDLPKN